MTEKVFENSWICSTKFKECRPLVLAHKESDKTPTPHHSKKYCNKHTFFVKKVELGSFNAAILKITADDYYKLYINGQFVTQGPANSYAHCYNYNEIDATEFLKKGTNTIAVHVHYQGYINRAYNSGDLRQGMIADLIVDNKNVIDSNWKCYDSKMYLGKDKVAYHTQFNEKLDYRKWIDWTSCECDTSKWETAPTKQVDYTFVKQITPNLEIYEIGPKTITATKNGYIIDFGTTITATIKMQATGKKGDRIKVRCGEELQEDGAVRYNMRCSTTYDDVFILGAGSNHLEQYEYKCFRYMQIIAKKTVAIDNYTAMVRHYPYHSRLTFDSDNELLKKTWDICALAVKYCSQEVYVDCPHREKGQYLGDLTVTGHSQMWLTGDTKLFKKAMDDFKQSTFICKGLTAVSPASFVQEIADFSLLYGYQQKLLYDFSGDKEELQRGLQTAEGISEYFSQFLGENGLLWNVTDKWNLVDWPKNLRDNYDFILDKTVESGCHNVINALYIGLIKSIEEIKDILGIAYTSQFEALKQSYISAFFDTDKGVYRDAIGREHTSLHANAYAMFYDILPEQHNIVSLIREKQLSCGVFMSYFVIMGLLNQNEYELAIALLTNTSTHSWFNMIKEGATTAFEAWGKDQKKNTSLCHAWASAPIMIITEGLLGLKMKAGKLTKQAREHSLSNALKLTIEYNGKHLTLTPADNTL